MSELANQVAIEIFQWKTDGDQDWLKPIGFSWMTGERMPIGEYANACPPRHDEDPIQALEVIDHMRARGFDWPIKLEPLEDGKWHADFHWHCGRSETLASAICEVGLAAWRAWREHKERL